MTSVAGTGAPGFGGDSGAAVSAQLDTPMGVAVDAAGNIYIADTANQRIREINTSGVITTIAGNGQQGYRGDGGAATSARLNTPTAIAIDGSGNIFIADSGNNVVREVSGGTISTIAGTGAPGYSGDNSAATSAELDTPEGVAVDASGHLYIADTANNVIREISGGTITTVAGDHAQGYSGDNGAASSAELNQPAAVTVDGSGNLYIADTGNHAVRKVAGGTITTVAGTGTPGYSGDGGAATSAQLDSPMGLAVDASGALYIADTANDVIRRVRSGSMATVGGNGHEGWSGDNGASVLAMLDTPVGLALDASGNLLIADQQNSLVRKQRVASLDFGSATEGQASASQTVTVANQGSGTLSITAAQLTSGTEFALASGGTCGTTFPVSVASASSCTFVLTMTPTGLGTRTDQLTITDSAASSPQIIALTGTGTGIPTATPSGTSLTYGNQLVGQASAVQSVTIANNGTAPLQFSAINVTGDYALDGSSTCSTSATVAVSASCTVAVTFTPTATGSRSGSVTLTDNATDSPQAVTLSGTGIQPAATLSASTLSYGNQLVGQTSAVQSITVTNSGTAPLHFSAINATGDYALDGTTTCSTSTAVATGATCTVAVKFTPTATGSRSGAVTVTDDAPTSPQAVILSGTGIQPAATLSASTLSYGNQLVGQSSAVQSITVTNSGTAPLHFSAINASGDYALDGTTTCSTSAAVATGATCTVAVKFTPTATGSRSGAVTVTDDAPTSPQAVILSGTGIQPAATLSASTLSYGNQLVGQASAVQSITVTNGGTAPLHFSAINATGDYALDGTTTCSTSAAVATGASCTVAVKFTPTATGSRSGAVTLTDDAPTSPQAVILSGTGIQPAATLSASTLSYGNQLVGQSSAVQSITVTNGGTAPLHFSAITATGDYALDGTTTCSTSAAVATGASCTVAVKFTPTATGSRSGAVTVTDDAPTSPQAVILSGTGIQPAATLSASTLSFGNQVVGQASAVQSMTVTNGGTAPLHFSAINASGDYALDGTTTCSTSTAVATGGTCTVAVKFTPTATGSRSGAVTLTDDAPTSPQEVMLSGTGVQPAATLSASTLSYGNQLVGQTSTVQSITVTNSGTAPLHFSVISATGDYALDGTTTCSTSTAVATGGSCTVAVKFTPTATGSRSGAVTLTDDAPTSPQEVMLSGTGVQPAATLSASTLSYGNQLVGQTSTVQSITVTNSGTAPLHFSVISATGDYALDGTTTCSTSTAVATGGSCTVAVKFTPTATGSRSGAVTLTDDAPTSPQEVMLSGTGVQPAATLSASTLSFGNQVVGQASAVQSMTVTNGGTAPLHFSAITATGDYALDGTTTCSTSTAVTTGASCTVAVKFTPTAAGSRSGAVTVTDDAPASPQNVILSGTGIQPAVTLSANVLTFGNQLVGQKSGVQSFTIANSGTSPLHFTGLAASGDYALDGTTTCSMGTAIATGSNCTIAVTFTPTVTGGRTGAVTLTDDAPNTPQSITLSGTGVQPAVNLSASSLGFGNQLLNQGSTVQTITVTNSGTSPLHLTGLAASGDYALDGSTTCSTSKAVAANATCVIAVTFTPAATGSRSGAMTLTDDAPTSPQSVTLAGTGVQPNLQLSSSSLVFPGTVLGQTSARQTITVTNSGTGDLSITGIAVSGDFRLDSGATTCSASQTVAAGSGCTVAVLFAPTATGARSATLTIQDSAPGSPHQVALRGTGTQPGMAVSPASLTFTSTEVGSTSAAQSITITNSGTAPLHFSQIAVSGDFKIDGASTCATATAVAAGASCAVGVDFAPGAAGSRSGNVSLSSDAPGSPVSVALTGTAVQPQLTLQPTSLSFGSQTVGTTSAAETVTLTNPGTAPLPISSVVASGDFAAVSGCGSSLAAGASCPLSVTFTPVVAGTRGGSLTLTDSIGVQTVALSGSGATPGVGVNPSAVNFGSQAIGVASSLASITLSNTGSVPLTLSGIVATGDFSVTSNCGTSLAAGSSCLLQSVFTPSSAGSKAGAITISDNAGTQTVALAGIGSAPGLSLSAARLSFSGEQVGSTSSAQTVKLANTGTATLALYGVSSTGDFSVSSGCGASLAPGANCSLSVSFTPSATGERSGTIIISSSLGSESIVVSGSGTAPAALLTPSMLDFGSAVVGTSSISQPVTLTDSGTSPLAISTISISGDYAQTNQCPASLAPGSSCTIDVIYSPGQTGTRSGTLTITDAAGTQTAAVTGNGLPPALPVITPAPAGLTFGSQGVGSASAAQMVVLSNQGSVPFAISGISVNGDFSQTNTCPATLAVGAQCSVSVVFTPAGAGTRAGSLGIATSGATTQYVGLVGVGNPAALTVSPASISFGSLPVGSVSAAQTVIVSNSGGAPLDITSISTGENFSETDDCTAALAPGASCRVNISFSPASVGARTGSIVVNSNVGPAAIGVSGSGTAAGAALTPITLNFGSIAVGATSASQTVTLTNSGTAPLAVGGVSIDGDFTEQSACPASLAAGVSCVINVALKPTASGARTGTLLVQDAAGVQVVALNGTGVGPGIAFSPTSLFFGSQPVGTTSPAQTVTVTNNGNAALQIDGIIPIGDFGETTTCGSTLDPGARCTINVTSTPEGVGTRTGNLLVIDNAGGGAQFISLSSSGIPAGILLSPASLNFGSEPVGETSAAQTVTLTNHSGSALAVVGISATGEMNVTNTCGSLIPEGGSCTLNVSVTPALNGEMTGQIILNLVPQSGSVANPGRRAGSASRTVRMGVSGTPIKIEGLISITARGATAGLTLSPSTVDFGSEPVGSSSAATSITLANGTATTVNLAGVSVTGAFTQTSNCGANLAPGGSCTIQAAFAPTATGAQTGTLTVSDDLGTQTVALDGNGTPTGLTVTPAQVSFPDTPVGGSAAAQTVTLSNQTGAAYALGGVTLTGDFSANANTCGASLADGASCTVGVVFAPTVQGARTGNLTIAGASPVVVALAGNGTAPPVSLTPALVSFSSVSLGSSSPAQIVTVTNSGSQPVALGAVTTTGDYAATSNCGASLAAGASCAIQVVFTPKDLGLRLGAVGLTAGGTALQTQVQGTGSGSALRLSLSQLNFGNGLIGSPSQPQTVTLTNLANTPLPLTNVTATGDYSAASTCGAALAGQASCTVSVTFTPTAMGDRTGTLVFTDGASDSPQTIALDGTGQQLSLTATHTSESIVVSGTATYGLTLTAAGYRGVVNFTCTGAPAGSQCLLSPGSMNVQSDQPAPLTVTVQTYPTTEAALPPVPPSAPMPPRWLLLGMLAALLMLLPVWFSVGGRRRALGLGAAVALLALVLAGCGGAPGIVNDRRPGTAAGQYKLTVTATTNTGVSRSIGLTLNVQ